MKKIATLLLLFTCLLGFSQQNSFIYPQDENKKNELKISASSLIVIASLDISYERLINEDTSFGVSMFYNTDRDNDIDFPREFSVTPFYRWFFSEETFARGFFVEGFGMLNVSDEEYSNSFIDSSGNFQSNKVEKGIVRFALGVSVGGKFVLKNGFTAEISLGIGRNLLGKNNPDSNTDNVIVSRGGISLGHRF